MKQSLAFLTAALMATLVVSCGRSGPTTSAVQLRAAQVAAAAAKAPSFGTAPATREAFVAAAKAKGVKLTEAQVELIRAERHVVPNGQFAARPAMNLSAQQNLDVHFKKHGHEFRPAIASAEAYVAQGNAAATGKRGEVRFFFDTTSFQKGYQSHVVRWVPATHDFTAFMADGSETTYYQNDPKPNRFIEVASW